MAWRAGSCAETIVADREHRIRHTEETVQGIASNSGTRFDDTKGSRGHGILLDETYDFSVREIHGPRVVCG
jgi:hypothetical protein